MVTLPELPTELTGVRLFERKILERPILERRLGNPAKVAHADCLVIDPHFIELGGPLLCQETLVYDQ